MQLQQWESMHEKYNNKPKYKQKWKNLNYWKSYQYPGQHWWEVNLYPFRGKLLATQTLSIKGREERVERDRSDVIICIYTQEENLPLPQYKRK